MTSLSSRGRCIVLVFIGLTLCPIKTPADQQDKFSEFFQPLETDWVSLSPNGARVAYSVFDERGLSLFVKDVDISSTNAKPPVLLKTFAPTLMSKSAADMPVVIRWMGWPTPDSLIVSIGQVGPKTSGSFVIGGPAKSARHSINHADTPLSGEIYFFDLKDCKTRLLIKYDARTALNYFGKIDHCELNDRYPGKLLLSAQRTTILQRTPPAPKIYAIDLNDGSHKELRQQSEQIFDTPPPERQQELQKLRPILDQTYPGKDCDVFSFDWSRKTALVLTQSVTDCGRFHVLDFASGNSKEVVKRTHHRAVTGLVAKSFAYTDSQNHLLTGWIVLPTQSRTKRAPVVFLDLDQPRCLAYPLPNLEQNLVGNQGDGQAGVQENSVRPSSLLAPFFLKSSTYRPEVVALASMGFAVVQISAFAPQLDNPIATRLSEVQFVLGSLSREFPVSTKAVALYGSQGGANLALNLLQRRPDVFRCAVGVDVVPMPSPAGPVSYAPDYKDGFAPPLIFALSATSMVQGKETVTPKIPEITLPKFPNPRSLNLPVNRANAFHLIEGFLNAQLYFYRVESGETKVIDEE